MLPFNECLQPPEYLCDRFEPMRAEADRNRRLKQAGLVPRPWLSCQACRMLSQLGHLLVTAGSRIEQRYRPLTPSHM